MQFPKIGARIPCDPYHYGGANADFRVVQDRLIVASEGVVCCFPTTCDFSWLAELCGAFSNVCMYFPKVPFGSY